MLTVLQKHRVLVEVTFFALVVYLPSNHGATRCRQVVKVSTAPARPCQNHPAPIAVTPQPTAHQS